MQHGEMRENYMNYGEMKKGFRMALSAQVKENAGGEKRVVKANSERYERERERLRRTLTA